MAASSNLYPPLIDTYTPTFLINSENINKNICKVYFSLSLFNDYEQIKNAQIVVRNQLTNSSSLDPNKYPCEIKLANIKIDENRATNDKYYVEIMPEDLKGQSFKINQYYKVQIRFTSVMASEVSLSTPQSIDSWLTTNLAHFSEWSTVTLVRGISRHYLDIKDFSTGAGRSEVYATVGNIPVLGQLVFLDSEEQDTLKYYKIKLFDSNNNQLTESEKIYSTDYINVNEINYCISYGIEPNKTYYFTIEYSTNTLYTDTLSYYFDCIEGETENLNATITASLDEENARTKIHIFRSASNEKFTGQIIIKRASNKDNFKIWEDLYIENYKDVKQIDSIWYDYTIECGTYYQYAIQGVDNTGLYMSMIKFPKNILAIFEDIFLVSKDEQIKIKYNPIISNFKKVLSESKTDTLGSIYPFIRRNGNVNYIQFSLGGLIASAMDEDGLFINQKNNYIDYYNSDEKYYNLSDTIDFIWEKNFREKIIKFLYNNTVKLFKSPSEGNLLIKLMDINFTPNQTLGRNIWTFNSTAVEVDECNLNKMNQYNIYTKINNIIEFTPDGGSSSLTPIQKIVYIQGDAFPDEGKSQVLYIYKKQLYLYDTVNNNYFIISIPYWNEGEYIIPDEKGQVNQLYTDSKNLFMWNNDKESFELISVPTTEE